MGQVDETTTVTFKTSQLLSMADTLRCQWNISLIHSGLGEFPYRITTVPATRVNDTFLTCETPSVIHGLIDASNNDWYLDSNATATVSVTKNMQTFTNSLPFYFHARHEVHSIYPSLATVTLILVPPLTVASEG
jgi:hypothetical protein